MSAFFNKQVVRNSNRLVNRFGLKKADAFKTTGLCSISFSSSRRLRVSHRLQHRTRRASALGALSGERSDEIDEKTADDLSVVLEGSTRTRANIVTYRSPGCDAVEHPELPLRPAQLPEQRAAGDAQRRGQRLRHGRLRRHRHLRPRDVRAGRLGGWPRRRAVGRDRRRRSARSSPSNEALQDTNPL